jgi:ATP-dependent DNA helicase DinG
MATALKNLKLYGLSSGDKFIPSIYKVNSREVRLSILAGLMDSDGSLIASKVGYDYISKSQQLANDVAFIARSVGLAAYLKPCKKQDQNGQGGTYYRVGISGNVNIIPCHVTRKKASKRQQKKNVLRTGVTVVPTLNTEEYYGFTLDGDGHFLLDDFTVTHNSFAYLIPAVLAKHRVVVSTAKKALQSQLLEKDLPYIQKVLRETTNTQFTFAAAYGKGNYACYYLAKKHVAKHNWAPWDIFFQYSSTWHWEDAEKAAAEHFKKTKNSGSKLKVIKPSNKYSAEHCIGANCTHFKTCNFQQARKEMLDADVVVANHWLVGYDIRLRQEMSFELLGEYALLIVDEAHKFEDGIRAAFTFEIRENALQQLIDDFESTWENLPSDVQTTVGNNGEIPNVTSLQKTWKALFNKVAQLNTKDPSSPVSAQTLGKEGSDLYTAIEIARVRMQSAPFLQHFFQISSSQTAGLIAVTAYSIELKNTHPIYATSENYKVDLWFLYKRTFERLLYFKRTLDSVANAEENRVSYVENTGRYKTLCTAPINVGPFLEFSHGTLKSTVYTSATLAINGSMDVFNHRLSLHKVKPSQLTTAQFGSAFDLNKQALLYVSKRVPIPTRKQDIVDDYRISLADEIYELITANQGDALVLFTARDEMNSVYENLSQRLCPFPLLIQSKASASELLIKYRTTPRAVLLGLKSFWEGIDVQGDKLQLVIVTKLPFPNRSDPVVAARREKAGDFWFQSVDIPDMTLDLRQGIGRLIRSTSDRGVIAILDQRLLTKGYRKQVLRSLGLNQITNNQPAVLRALNNLSKQRKCYG